MLPKIHKKDNPGRPIVSACNCPTELISKFLDSVLSPIVSQLPSYVKDTSDALHTFTDFEFTGPSNYLFSMDVKSLYTCIPHVDGLQALRYYLDRRDNCDPPTSTLLRLAELVLTLNNFTFNGKHYLQTSGVAMGTRMGPSYACLFVGFLEEKMLSNFPGPKPLLYKRYIDDIIGATSGSKEDIQAFIDYADHLHPALHFTSKISSDTVTFLDISVRINGNCLTTSVHYKPTDSHSYLHYQSSHPKKCKDAIPYSQFLRLRRICSEDTVFQHRSKEMKEFFNRRGYPAPVTDAAIHKVSSVTRSDAMKQAPPKKQHRIPLVLTYHPLNLAARDILLKHFKTLQDDPATSPIFDPSTTPLCSFRRDRSIGNHLVRSSLPATTHTTDNVPYRTAPCQRPRCKTCAHINGTSSINGPRGRRHINDHYTCTTTNLVYCITCTRCGQLYIGETRRRLADRFTEHLRSVRLNQRGLAVAQHFSTAPHCTEDMSVCVVATASSDTHRKTLEQRIIFQLGTLHPDGMNVEFHAFGTSTRP